MLFRIKIVLNLLYPFLLKSLLFPIPLKLFLDLFNPRLKGILLLFKSTTRNILRLFKLV